MPGKFKIAIMVFLILVLFALLILTMNFNANGIYMQTPYTSIIVCCAAVLIGLIEFWLFHDLDKKSVSRPATFLCIIVVLGVILGSVIKYADGFEEYAKYEVEKHWDVQDVMYIAENAAEEDLADIYAGFSRFGKKKIFVLQGIIGERGKVPGAKVLIAFEDRIINPWDSALVLQLSGQYDLSLMPYQQENPNAQPVPSKEWEFPFVSGNFVIQ